MAEIENDTTRRDSSSIIGLSIFTLTLCLFTPGWTMPNDYPPAIITESDKENTVSGITIKRRVQLIKGGAFTLRLKANPGTGYSWVLKKIDTGLIRVASQDIAGGHVPGGAQDIIFRFEALAVGETTIELHYARSFEKNKQPLRIFNIDVRVF